MPVLRPLYTNAFAKLGSTRGWNSYPWKSSRSHGSSAIYSSKSKGPSILSGNTSHPALASKDIRHGKWAKVTETDSEGRYEDMKSLASPIDKPLPPAYSFSPEEDTGYHTWSWNLLSRPRKETLAPKLTRSPNLRDCAPSNVVRKASSARDGAAVVGNGKFWGRASLPRLKKQTLEVSKRRSTTRQPDERRSPLKEAKTSTSPSRWQSPSHSPISEADSWASPSMVPTKHVSRDDMMQRPIPGSPDDGFSIQPRSQSKAQEEDATQQRPAGPRLGTNNQWPLRASSAQSAIAISKTDSTCDKPTGTRSFSSEVIEPPTVPHNARETVRAAISRGYAM